jgi:hypothetical protein
MRAEIVAAALLAQAGGIVLWWLGLRYRPSTRSWFFPGGVIEPEMAAFLAPDLIVLAGGSIVAAWLAARGHRRASVAAWCVAGASVYATVFTVAWARAVGAPAASPLLMSISAVLSVICALAVSRGR